MRTKQKKEKRVFFLQTIHLVGMIGIAMIEIQAPYLLLNSMGLRGRILLLNRVFGKKVIINISLVVKPRPFAMKLIYKL